MYTLARRLLFLFDAEKTHYFSMNALRLFCKWPFHFFFRSFIVDNTGLKKNVFGISFKNPVILAAGFDKNAAYLKELDMLGFGAVEIGTVTPLPQIGNAKPRLFRLPADKALINRMGFNNAGASAVAENIRKWRAHAKESGSSLIIGGNIGKNKDTPNDEAWKDYVSCFNTLFPYVDYFVINISSPNTPGLRDLQQKGSIRKIFMALREQPDQIKFQKPLLLKIAPDLNEAAIDDIVAVAMELQLSGLIISNTTLSREGLATGESKIKAIGAGGLSGKPLCKRSTEMIRYFHLKTKGSIPIIASGGIFTGNDALEKLQAGANLIQVWTGFIYEGPIIVKNICKSLIK